MFLLPLIQLVTMSFADDYRNPTTVFTLENYVEIFTRAYHLESLVGSLAVSTTSMAAAAVVGYPVAYYLVHSTSKYKSLILLATISPLLTSIVVRGIGWLILLGENGVANQVMLTVGIIDEPVRLLYNFGAVIVGEVNILLPFMVLSIMTSLGQIPRSLTDNAAVLGATASQRFLRITLPLSAPGLVSGAVLVFILAMGSYVTPKMLGGGMVKVVTMDIYSRMLVDFNWPLGAALAVITMLLTLSILLILSRVQARLIGNVRL